MLAELLEAFTCILVSGKARAVCFRSTEGVAALSWPKTQERLRCSRSRWQQPCSRSAWSHRQAKSRTRTSLESASRSAEGQRAGWHTSVCSKSSRRSGSGPTSSRARAWGPLSADFTPWACRRTKSRSSCSRSTGPTCSRIDRSEASARSDARKKIEPA